MLCLVPCPSSSAHTNLLVHSYLCHPPHTLTQSLIRASSCSVTVMIMSVGEQYSTDTPSCICPQIDRSSSLPPTCKSHWSAVVLNMGSVAVQTLCNNEPVNSSGFSVQCQPSRSNRVYYLHLIGTAIPSIAKTGLEQSQNECPLVEMRFTTRSSPSHGLQFSAEC